MHLDTLNVSASERQELERLIALSPHNPPVLEDMWRLMDRVWSDLGCDNGQLDWDQIGAFYRHPIWLLNGLFVEADPTSMQHRQALARWIHQRDSEIRTVLDYGGGFGTLARLIAADHEDRVHVDVLDPFPHQAALDRAASFSNVAYVSEIDRVYDCIVCTDVLEHVPDPLATLAGMIETVRVDGYLLIANHFKPSIQCHLPTTFHLHYTFDLIVRYMGLAVLGPCEDSHATCYRKKHNVTISWPKLRLLERGSRAMYPALSAAAAVKHALLR